MVLVPAGIADGRMRDGQIAALARRYRVKRVRALVPVGSALSGFDAGEGPPQQWEELVAAEDAGDLGRLSELEVQIRVDGPYRGPEGVDSGVRDLIREMNLIALKNEASGLGDECPLEPPAVNRLVEIQVPSLVIFGDRDNRPGTIEAADILKRSIPRARRAVIAGTAHLPNRERPQVFSRVVVEFLEGLGV